MDRSEADRFRCIDKDPKKDRDPDKKTDSHKLCHHHAERKADGGAFFCPVCSPGSKILAHKGRERHGHAHDREKRDPLKLRKGTLSGDRECAECIDI